VRAHSVKLIIFDLYYLCLLFSIISLLPEYASNSYIAKALYQTGYEVGRFISLEKIVETSKEGYYSTLYQCSQGWHKGKHSLGPWTEYLLGTLIATYREFEDRAGLLTTGRGTKTEIVLEAIGRFHGNFSVSELQEQCPNVGIDLIRRILHEALLWSAL
jgi:hypothetical protein